jgi:hypothetical protein
MRFLYFATDETGELCISSTMQSAIVEVLDIPEDYTDGEALAITDTVHRACILKAVDHGAPREGRFASPGRRSLRRGWRQEY